MKKYKCPYCENESFSLVSKMFTGGWTSKGTACPLCGKHAVHGVQATVINTVIMSVALIFIIVNYKSSNPNIPVCFAVLAGAYLICRVINGLFFELTLNNRRDFK